MNAFQAWGLVVGLIIGAVEGGTLCRVYGTLACVGGAVAGGFGGMIAGMVIATILVRVCIVPYAFARVVARIYWELLTGRRKLPDRSTQAERRQLYIAIVIVFAAALAAMAATYLFGSDAQRSRVPPATLAALVTCVTGFLILRAHHRRHRTRSVNGGKESHE
jgi:hypothetical protein